MSWNDTSSGPPEFDQGVSLVKKSQDPVDLQVCERMA